MARKVIAEFDAIDGPFINKLRAIDRSVTRFEVGTLSAFGRIERGMNGLLASASRLQNVSGIIAGGFGTGLAVQFVDQATRIRRALKEAGDESQEGFEKAFLASQRSLAGFEAFTQGVQRAKKATGGSFDEAIRDMETLNKLLVLGGKTTQERMSTNIQFSQALQAGVLQGEELRSLRENAPIELIRAIAREAGGTIEDLKKFGEAGVLTTDVMIRALRSLEKEADARMKAVTLTISEAATVMANAGIVATEGFDKGLGLSRAAVAGLTYLADVLAKSAEASEFFSRALGYTLSSAEVLGLGLKGIGAGLAAAFGGRRISETIAAQAAFSQSLKATAAATALAERASGAALVKSQARVQALRAETAALIQKGAAEKAIASAQSRLTSAQSGLAVATARHTAAVGAAIIANERLAFSSRAVAAAGSLTRGAWAFLGGLPGLILAAGTAFLMLSSSAESAAERFERLTSDTGEAATAADALREVQARLNEAIAESGSESDSAARKIIANTREEMAAKRDLLALENQRLVALQSERNIELSRLIRARDGIEVPETRVTDILQSQMGESGAFAGAEESAAALIQAQREYNAEVSAANEKIIELSANMSLTGGVIDANNALLAESVSLTEATRASAVSMIPGYSALEDSARAFADRLSEAWGNAEGVASTDMASGISEAGAEARGLAGWLAQAYDRAKSIAQEAASANAWLEARSVANTPGNIANLKYAGRGTMDSRPVTFGDGTAYIRPESGSAGGSNGGGGGQSQDREALEFIESMMTAEEKRAKQIKEMTDLRKKLVATYGEESALVQQLDEALNRVAESAAGANSAAQSLRDTILDAAVNGEGLSGVLSEVANMAKRAAYEMLLFNTGPWATSGGGKGLLGGLVGMLGGIFQPRANGGPVAAGVPYLVNENTPNSEIFVPSANGAVLNLAQAQSALRGATSRSGVVEIIMRPEQGVMVQIARNEANASIRTAAPGIAGAAVKQVVEMQRENRTLK